MSEYQYYEFQAIDRPLTAKEQAAIQKLSSRVQLTPHRAIFLYHYGDLRGKPEDVLTKYFDVMLDPCLSVKSVGEKNITAKLEKPWFKQEVG